MWRKVLSWTSVVLNGLWLPVSLWFVVNQMSRQPPPNSGIAYDIGYWVAMGLFSLFLLGMPTLSILAVIFGARLREPPAAPSDPSIVFE